MAKKQKNPVRKGAKVETFIVEAGSKKYEFSIQEPTIEELGLAFAKLANVSGEMNFVKAGLSIWETCVVEYDEEIEKNQKVFLDVLLKLANTYLDGIGTTEIKKKAEDTKD